MQVKAVFVLYSPREKLDKEEKPNSKEIGHIFILRLDLAWGRIFWQYLRFAYTDNFSYDLIKLQGTPKMEAWQSWMIETEHYNWKVRTVDFNIRYISEELVKRFVTVIWSEGSYKW